VHERLSWKEICGRYPDTWVVLVEVEHAGDYNQEIISAVVLGHSRSRGESLRATKHMRVGMDCAHLWTGKLFTPP
jgi:hypothetical protein